jgi:GTPase SAR1 family protein
MGIKLSTEIYFCDHGGLERIIRLFPLHIRRSSGAIIVYDTTNIDSFNNAATKWLPLIRLVNSSAKLLLLGTKIDCEREVSS